MVRRDLATLRHNYQAYIHERGVPDPALGAQGVPLTQQIVGALLVALIGAVVGFVLALLVPMAALYGGWTGFVTFFVAFFAAMFIAGPLADTVLGIRRELPPEVR